MLILSPLTVDFINSVRRPERNLIGTVLGAGTIGIRRSVHLPAFLNEIYCISQYSLVIKYQTTHQSNGQSAAGQKLPPQIDSGLRLHKLIKQMFVMDILSAQPRSSRMAEHKKRLTTGSN